MHSLLKKYMACLSLSLIIGGCTGVAQNTNAELRDKAVVISQQPEQIEKELIESVKYLYISFYKYLQGEESFEELEKKKKKADFLDRLVDAYDFKRHYDVNNVNFYEKHNLYVFTGQQDVEGDEFPTFCVGTDVKDTMVTVDLGNRKVRVHRVIFGKTLVPMLQNYIRPNTLLSWTNGHTVFQEKAVFEAIAGMVYDNWDKYEAANRLKELGKIDSPDWDVKEQLMYDEFSKEYYQSNDRDRFISIVYPRLMYSKFIHEANHLYDYETNQTMQEYNSYRKEMSFGSDQKYNLAFYLERKDRNDCPHTKAAKLLVENIMEYIHENQHQYPGIVQEKDLYKLSKEQISEIAREIE